MIDPSDNAALAALLPYPDANTDKYRRGMCVLFAGNARCGGAAVLATRACQRMGAGYVKVHTAPGNELLIRLSAPSAVVRTWSPTVLAHLADAAERHPVAYVVGPGFDADDGDVRQILSAVLKTAAPVCVDGGALQMLATRQAKALLEVRAQAGQATVITPHLGEAVKLARALDEGFTVEGPRELVRFLAENLQVTAVLKGPLTFICHGAELVCMDRGTAALARAGTGDVLAGMVGALLAQGLKPEDAAVLATRLHAEAGRLASDGLTDIAVLPEDIIEAIPRAIMVLGKS